LSVTARLTIINSTIQNCTATYGGAIDVTEESTVELVNTMLLYNVAPSKGGGISASDNSWVITQNVTVQGNTAKYGGGLAIEDDASLDLVGPSRVEFNQARNYGGGVYLESDYFTAEDVMPTSAERLLAYSNNTAPRHPDVWLATVQVDFVSSNNSLDNFVASLDSDGGMVYAFLNMKGPQGLPTNDLIAFEVLNDKNQTMGTQTLTGRPANYPDEGLKEVAVKIKPPGVPFDAFFFVLQGNNPAGR
jgi:hypothetical protein